jgi:protein TonB
VARKKKLSPVFVVSLLAHLGVGVALAMIPQEKLREVVAIAMQELPKDAKKPQPPKSEPPPRAAETQTRTHAARAPRAAAAQPTAASASANANAAAGFTDLGLTLDANSADGLAVAVAPPPSAEPRSAAEAVAKVIKPKLLVARKADGERLDPPPKPRPLGIVRPSYTEEARRARVEGRVRLELDVDEQGVVTAARVLEGLGYGLDEAALAAAKNLRFAAAQQDGRAVASRFILAMRFLLGT